MIRSIISLHDDDKKWLHFYSKRLRVPAAEIVRRAIKLYRRQVSQGGYERVIRETSGAWKTSSGDGQQIVDSLRAEWEKTT